jgi:hypothetical protein
MPPAAVMMMRQDKVQDHSQYNQQHEIEELGFICHKTPPFNCTLLAPAIKDLCKGNAIDNLECNLRLPAKKALNSLIHFGKL